MSALGTISLLGTTALLFEAPGDTDLPTQRRIWALAAETESWPEVAEAVPGMNNLMLVFTKQGSLGKPKEPCSIPRGSEVGERGFSHALLLRPPAALAALEARVHAAWAVAVPSPAAGRTIELPVVYGGPGGPHMADVVAHTGLTVDEIVALHSAPTYPVYALGSHPGYCYLGGMDPRLATPRRRSPVLSLPGGSVSIGGAQTGVSASPGPSGWNTIGTAAMRFFDPARSPPALLAPGDSLRFTVAEVIR